LQGSPALVILFGWRVVAQALPQKKDPDDVCKVRGRTIMKVKKEYLILAVLIVTLSLYVYFRQQDRTHYELPVLVEVPASEIMKIEISKGQGPILRCERMGDG
jgi:hypothetical protein